MPVGGRLQLVLLAFLLVRANQAVSRDVVSDAVWGPSRSGADNRLQMAISRLRRALAPLERSGEPVLRTVSGGYLLSVGPGELDAEVFGSLVKHGRGALEAGDPSRAVELLTRALALWRGSPLAEVAFEDFAQPEIRRLDELRLVATEARVDAELRLGGRTELVGELEGLVAEHPTRERLVGQLMTALYRSGRQADALEVFQRTRLHLARELGLEPGPALTALQLEILGHAPSLQATAPAPAPAPVIVPSPPAAVVASPPASGGEHRKTVTALFVDLVGSTVIGDQLDPEALRGVMVRYYEALRAAVEAHGGRVEKFIGDAVVAIFGVPVVHEDDALRAVRAAVLARERLEQLNAELAGELGVRLQTRAAVNTGEVVVGDRSAGQGFVVGDVLNVAARLEQGASAGEVLLGESTFAIVRDAIRAERLEARVVKGKAAPVLAYRLLELAERGAGRPRRHRSPLVGRAHELRLLEEAYARVGRERGCHLFTVLGPAGVGKSRLIEEATAACEGATVLAGRCLPYGEGITFWALAEIIRAAAKIREGDEGEQAQRKLAALLQGDEGEQRANTIAAILAGVIGVGERAAGIEESFWATRRLCESIASSSPLIVIFEDVHWAEPTLLDLIDHVAEMSREAPILIVCLARPELLDARPAWGGGKRNATAINLEPLSPTESAQLIENLLPNTALPAELSARIAAGSEGFPLFVEEMIAILAEQGMLQPDSAVSADLAGMPVPATIRALLAARLDGLPVVERRALELASVVGREFWQHAITAIDAAQPEAASTPVLSALVRKDLIVPERSTLTGDDSYRFRHVLIRDAAYESLPKAERADLHERLASWLEQSFAERLTEVQEIIGYHLEHAHNYRTTLGQPRTDLAERAATHLGAGGRRALVRHDLQAAISLLERARSLSPTGAPEHRQLGLDLGAALFRTAEFGRATAVLEGVETTAKAAQDSLVLARARIDLAQIKMSTDPEGAAANARLEADAAMPIFWDAGDHLGIGRALLLGAEPDRLENHYTPFRQACERALDHVRTARDRYWELWALVFIADAVTLGPTPVPAAIARMQQILRDSTESLWLQAQVHIRTGFLLALDGRRREAQDAEAHGEAIMRDLAVEVDLLWCAWHVGRVLRWLHRLDEAARVLEQGDELCERSGERSLRSTILAALAEVRFDQGRTDEAKQTAQHAIEIGSSDDYLTLMLAHGTIARVLADHGDPAAEAAARTAVALAEHTDMLWAQGEQLENLATALLAQRRDDEANEALREALDRFERKGASALADRVRARLR